jgi:hypothetical protein
MREKELWFQEDGITMSDYMPSGRAFCGTLKSKYIPL